MYCRLRCVTFLVDRFPLAKAASTSALVSIPIFGCIARFFAGFMFFFFLGMCVCVVPIASPTDLISRELAQRVRHGLHSRLLVFISHGLAGVSTDSIPHDLLNLYPRGHLLERVSPCMVRLYLSVRNPKITHPSSKPFASLHSTRALWIGQVCV